MSDTAYDITLGTIGTPARDGSTVMDVVKRDGVLYKIEVYKNKSTWVALYDAETHRKINGGDQNVIAAIKMWVRQPNFASLNAHEFVNKILG
jgi:hypothetical protein